MGYPHKLKGKNIAVTICEDIWNFNNDFYDQDPEVINEAMGTLAQLTEDIDSAMERWAELED